MGILKELPSNYYDNTNPDWGAYQKLSLAEIIQSFNATYVGEGKICEKILINDITFHAIRGLQELSYDTLRSQLDWELVVPSTLVVVLPLDYVNYIKVAWSDSNGIERVLYPASKTSNPADITEVNTVTGTAGEPETFGGFTLAGADLGTDNSSETAEDFQNQEATDIGSIDSDLMDDHYGNLLGQRYGIDPQYAQANGSFFIDESEGRIHFSSNMAGKTLVLKYISDGLVGTGRPETNISLENTFVHKFAEEAIYKHILYGCLLAKSDTDPNLLSLLKKERSVETRKAKLRLSNYKIEELTQIVRGGSKQIKH